MQATKRRGHHLDVLGGDPDARVVHGHGDLPVGARGHFRADAPTGRRELDCVTQEIDENLPHPLLIHAGALWRERAETIQHDSLLLNLWRYQADRRLHQIVQAHHLLIEALRTRFNFGDVEQRLGDDEQMTCADVDVPYVFSIAWMTNRPECLLDNHLGEPEDRG